MPKTPEAALVAAQAYIYTTQPTPGDPREHMHRETLQGLRLVGSKLTAREEEPCLNEGTHKPRSPRHHNSPRHRSRSRRSRSPSPKHYNSQRHEGTQRSKSPKQACNYKDNEKEMGASCFTRRTPVPKGFKLSHDQQKYDGSQETRSWLSDYLQAVRILGGSKEIAMKSLQLPHHRRGTVMVKQARQGNNWNLGQTHKAVHKQFQFDLQTTGINGRSQSLYAEAQ
jgi:hypothetical protein